MEHDEVVWVQCGTGLYYSVFGEFDLQILWAIIIQQRLYPTSWTRILATALNHVGCSVHYGDQVERRQSEEVAIICS